MSAYRGPEVMPSLRPRLHSTGRLHSLTWSPTDGAPGGCRVVSVRQDLVPLALVPLLHSRTWSPTGRAPAAAGYVPAAKPECFLHLCHSCTRGLGVRPTDRAPAAAGGVPAAKR